MDRLVVSSRGSPFDPLPHMPTNPYPAARCQGYAKWASLYQEMLLEGTRGWGMDGSDTKNASKCLGTLVLYSGPDSVCDTGGKEAAWGRLGTF